MFASIFCLLVSSSFCPPQPWSLDFAVIPRIPLVADLNGDGFADMVVVDPSGEGFIDVSLNQQGQKAGRSFRAMEPWKPGVQAAAIGSFDSKPGVDVAGVCNGRQVFFASGLPGGKFSADPEPCQLPAPLAKPFLLDTQTGTLIVANSEGKAYAIDGKTKKAQTIKFPKGMVWAQADAPHWAMKVGGQLGTWKETTFKPISGLKASGTPAAYGDRISFDQKVATPDGKVTELPEGKFRFTNEVRAWGDFDNDGDPDLLICRNGTEKHWAYSIQLIRTISSGETDPDHDGLTNDQEAALGTDPLNPDTDNDGLLDGWEVGTIRGLDLKAMGCSPLHVDVICYIAPFEGCEEEVVKKNMERAKRLYAEIRTKNLDGTTGFALHVIYQPFILKAEQNTPWWELRDKYLPANQRGVAHWMQITPWGGGQAGQLDDGGGCGGYKGAAWNPFVHEFGHQLGMDHNGFWGPNWCPIYTSLMSYTYGGSFEDDGEKIHFSNGDLCSYVIHETDLDETLPLPYDQVKFLEKGPYRYALKPNGNTTLIDWNWNGVFGEKHIQADVNYGYSTSAGERDNMDYCDSAPWLFTHQGKAYALYGQRTSRGNGTDDPSISAKQPGALLLRELIKPTVWKQTVRIEKDTLVGDPEGISFGEAIALVYATPQGIKLNWVDALGSAVRPSSLLDTNTKLVPSVGIYNKRMWIFLWNPENGRVTYRVLSPSGKTIGKGQLDQTSKGPVGMVENTYAHRMVIGMSQDQDPKQPNRWQVRTYQVTGTQLREESMEWVEGEKGRARGTGRCVLLYERNKNTAKEGRLIYYSRGGEPSSKIAVSYCAMQIANKAVKGGWLVKMYYDEWSNSRSSPTAAWFNGDIIYGYRWYDDRPSFDNRFHVGYRGTGIELEAMSDHDDVTFFKEFGVRHSILTMGAP